MFVDNTLDTLSKVASSIESQAPGVEVVIQVRVSPKHIGKEDSTQLPAEAQEKVELSPSGNIMHSIDLGVEQTTPGKSQRLKQELDAGPRTPCHISRSVKSVLMKAKNFGQGQSKSLNPDTCSSETQGKGEPNDVDRKNIRGKAETKSENATEYPQDINEKENKGNRQLQFN